VLIKSLESLLQTNNYSVMQQFGTSAFNTVDFAHFLRHGVPLGILKFPRYCNEAFQSINQSINQFISGISP